MKPVFHEGEREIQRQAGVEAMAKRVGNGIHDAMPPAAQEFLHQQPFAVIGSRDTTGNVWASLLMGEPGFLRALDARTVQIKRMPLPSDPLYATLYAQASGVSVGLLAIELATRRRMRVNGVATVGADGIRLRVEQTHANCPKYIQARTLTIEPTASPSEATVQQSERLTEAQRQWIAQADTFFIASTHPQYGTDASHRGGNPGFIHLTDETTLLFPDYAGNMMFNTLGNLAVNSHAGLLFVDFETGDMLQLTGTTDILWDAETIAAFPGAQRVVRFQVTAVRATSSAVPLRWRLVSRSPFNPK